MYLLGAGVCVVIGEGGVYVVIGGRCLCSYWGEVFM